MYANITSFGVCALDGYKVIVEADISGGLPQFEIVGLPDSAVKESRDRVRSSLKNLGFQYPVSRITVNLAPGDVKKSGPVYDLPILLALLKASNQLKADLTSSGFVGELSLNGELRPIKGAISMALSAKESGIKSLFLPQENAHEACVVEGIDIFAISHVSQLIEHLKQPFLQPEVFSFTEYQTAQHIPDLSEVKGQLFARRALEIAAAGAHNMLMVGFPGSGKSMLAKRMPSILPPLSFEHSVEVTKIYSIAGLLSKDTPIVTQPPFRAPHHSVSAAGLAGGGSNPRPGEISLAHNGVLFLDELAEFRRDAIEILRQPIEDGVVNVSRVSGNVSFPCRTILIAATNPCPCGYNGHPTRPCTCPPHAVLRYLNKLSGPLTDRIDLHVNVDPVDYKSLSTKREQSENSKSVLQRVVAARARQEARFGQTGVHFNSDIPGELLKTICPLSPAAEQIMSEAFEHLSLSARGYIKVLKVSLTIADLDGSDSIEEEHLLEALQYRCIETPTVITY